MADDYQRLEEEIASLRRELERYQESERLGNDVRAEIDDLSRMIEAREQQLAKAEEAASQAKQAAGQQEAATARAREEASEAEQHAAEQTQEAAEASVKRAARLDEQQEATAEAERDALERGAAETESHNREKSDLSERMQEELQSLERNRGREYEREMERLRAQQERDRARREQEMAEWEHISDEEKRRAAASQGYFEQMQKREAEKADDRARNEAAWGKHVGGAVNWYKHGQGAGATGARLGMAAGKGGIAAAKAGKDAYAKANQGFMQMQENTIKGIQNTFKTGKKAVNTGHTWFFALLVLFFHAIDAFHYHFGLEGQAVYARFVVYLLVAFWASFAYYKTKFTKESLTYFGISALCFGLPYVQKIPFFDSVPIIADYFTVVLALVPIWFYYIAFHEKEGHPLRNVAAILIFITILLFFVVLIMNITLPDLAAPGGRLDVGGALTDFWAQVKQAFGKLWETLGGIFSIETLRSSLNATFNPAMAYYSGQIEQNSDENVKLGVYIRDLRTGLETFHPGTDIALLGKVEAESFLPGGVDVRPSCQLRGYEYSYAGQLDLEELPLNLNYGIQRPVRCTFPWDEAMLNDTAFTGVMAATFDFETWSYITNTFVARQTIENYYQQEQDINDALDIPRRTEAVYTQGPIMLGILADRQPIDVDPDAPTPEKIVNQQFGFTVQSRWPQGQLLEVYEVEVLVPMPFTLNKCYPEGPRRVRDVPENRTRIYTFAGTVLDDPRYDYETVTCQLDLPSRFEAEQVLSFGEKVPTTFVVRAQYRYRIEETTSVMIER